ncbi:AAA family ATPase [Peribacillus sp. AS_2]|uniref:ATP-binding protein n=1 Tax=Peribacillus sp. AS_2 TaxID=2996755 RepID=UPI0022A72014|nr:AAA family ATPase [Peribacillus sp. AS_2]MCZ0872017.1 AAA family ATPase [Peribacillus sp. AS_2]
MIIKDLHVYGYGKLENQRFPELGQLQIFFGENESGKSTLMSFIHSMLFGFPTKVQIEPRYEPKMHAKYGGRLSLITKKDGEIVIERVKGKATGDVKLTFEDGRVGGEEELNEILHGVDKNYYQAIFSFDLQGLQGLHTLSEGTMSKYLLSAGLIGNDKLLEAETKLQKELDSRFKPSGQKPLLNVKMKELKELQKKVKASEEEQQSYTALLQEEAKLKEELSKVTVDIQEIEEDLVNVSAFLRIKPLVEEQGELEAEISKIPDVNFPVDGLKRLEQLQAVGIPMKAQLAALTEKMNKLEGKLTEIKINPFIKEHKEQIEHAIDQGTLLEKLELDIRKAEHETLLEEKNIEKVKQELFLDVSDEEIRKLDISTFMKERVKRAEREKHQLQNDKKQLDEKYELQKGSLETTEARLKEIKAQLLPDEKRIELESLYNKQNNIEFEAAQSLILDEQILELEKQLGLQRKKEADNHKRSHIMNGSLIVLLCLGAIGSYFSEQILLGVILLTVAVLFAVSRYLFKGDDISSGYIRQLDEMKRKRAAIGSETNKGSEGESMGRLLELDQRLQRRFESESFKYEEREEAFESTIQEYADWEASRDRLDKELRNILSGWGLSYPGMEINLESVFELLEKWKEAVDRKYETIKRHDFLQAEFEGKSKALFHFANSLDFETSTWREAIGQLKRELNKAVEFSVQLTQWMQERSRLTNEIEQLTMENGYLDAEMEMLFNLAKVKDEEEFRHVAALSEKKITLQKQLDLIAIQIGQSRMLPEQIQSYLKQGINTYTFENLEQKRKDSVKVKSLLLEKRADAKHKIKQLEVSGIYDDLLHRFHEEKAAFNEEAKEWAKLAIAKSLLNKTLDRYKRERLPKVIADAERHFSFLTNGNYRKIILDQSGEGILVQRSDGLSFRVEEVSRGTAEQIYVSLRLALADHTFENDSFPLIIDDSFVNFDAERTKRMLELLKKVSKKRQILFFTCHRYIMEHFSENQVIRLSSPVLRQNMNDLIIPEI